MKKLLKNLLVSLSLLSLIFIPVKTQALEMKAATDASYNKKICDFKMANRKLWIDHILWTRSFIVSDTSSLEDKDLILKRLLKNQEDIGASISPYYGKEAGNKLTALLKEHIEIAGKLTDAAKTKNKSDLENYNKLWYENADRISEFLSSANPSYSNKMVKDMLYKHLELVTDQVLGRVNKDWNADITSFDKGEDHMIMFADMITEGTVKQFPEKFR